VKKIKPIAFCAIWNFSSPDLMQKCNKSNCCYLPCIAIKASVGVWRYERHTFGFRWWTVESSAVMGRKICHGHDAIEKSTEECAPAAEASAAEGGHQYLLAS